MLFDIRAARRPREVAYVEELNSLSEEFIASCGTFDPLVVEIQPAFFKKAGVPDNAAAEIDVLPPRDKKWERQMRHRTGYFLPFHQKEAFCFSKFGLQETCTPIPDWLEPFEVHYGPHVESPPVVTYMGSALSQSNSSSWWQVFCTEWAALCAFELMYQARRGPLHHWSVELRRGIRSVGCLTIMGQGEELGALFREIELKRWSLGSPKNRSLPDHTMSLRVTVSGNWVAFNPETWESEMKDSMYFEEAMMSAPLLDLTTRDT